VTLRPPATGDAAALVALSGELGYETRVEDLRERIARIGPQSHHLLLVAQGDDGRILGWVHAAEHELFESGCQGEILGLVVDPRGRRRGVGRTRIGAVERWVASRGFPRVVVRSNVVRAESHPFYEALGFERVKSQHVYRKPLALE